MQKLPNKTERIHSLDSLRAIMMMLGIVIHSAITYSVTNNGAKLNVKDPDAINLSNDFIVSLIHAFRMPIFFLIAGFFGAMLFYERKPLRMIKNRISRIVYPFIVFLLLLWPTVIFTFGYTRLIFKGSNNALIEILDRLSSYDILVPKNTFHLWFLYYLTFITFVSIGLALIFEKLPFILNFITNVFSWIIKKTILRIFIFAGLTAIVYFVRGSSTVSTSSSFVLNTNTFIFYFSFYFVGWILYKSKHLLETFMKYDRVYFFLGLFLFSIFFFMHDSFRNEVNITLNSIMVWLFIFGITGIFIRFGSNYSSIMRYISDSSYWIYLIHFPLTAIIPSLLFYWSIPATLKFLIVLISTGIICFVSYHYLVRATFIGKFLNGRKYSINKITV